MVIAGELSMVVTADTSSLEKANRKTKSAMKEMQKGSDGASTSLERVKAVAGGVGSKLALIGKVGVGALTELGLASPVLAGQMAKIKTSLFEVGNTMGGIIEPAVEGVGRALDAFGGLLSDNSDTLTFFTKTVVDGLANSLKGLGMIWDGLLATSPTLKWTIDFVAGGDGFLNELIRQLGPEAAAALVGAKLGGVPGAIGAATGVGVTRRIADPSLMTFGTPFDEPGLGAAGKRAAGMVGTGAAVGAGVGALFGGVGAAPGALIGGTIGATGFLINEIVNLFKVLNQEQTSADVAFATTGVS